MASSALTTAAPAAPSFAAPAPLSAAPAHSTSSSALVRFSRGLRRTFTGLVGSGWRLIAFAAPLVSVALDYAWFAGSTALLLSLPLLVEVQRETTVLVMQRQREQELAAIQEQARLQHGGVLDQMKAMASLATGSLSGAPSGAEQQR